MIIAVNESGTTVLKKDYVIDSGLVVRVTSARGRGHAISTVLDYSGGEPHKLVRAGVGARVAHTPEVAVRCALANLVTEVCVWYKGYKRDALIAAITEVMDFIG